MTMMADSSNLKNHRENKNHPEKIKKFV